jgi:DnaA-homolog protein
LNEQLVFELPLRVDATYANYRGSAGARLRQLAPLTSIVSGLAGSGKTHLLQAACHDAESQGKECIYLDLRQPLEASIFKSLDQFPVIAVDHLDAVVGDRDWELAIFDLMNAVQDSSDSWLLLALVKHPRQVKFCLNDLASRCRSAMLIVTDQLDDGEKVKLLQTTAQQQGFCLPEEVARFMINRMPRDLPHLLENMKLLASESLRRHRLVTIPFVKETLRL